MDLWRANRVLARSSFMGSRDEMQQVFSYLGRRSIGFVRLRQLVKARLLLKEESDALAAAGNIAASGMRFDDFCVFAQPLLVAKFCQNLHLAAQPSGLRKPRQLRIDQAGSDAISSPHGD